MMDLVLSSLQEWLDEIDASEEEVRRHVKLVFPSWRVVFETGQGLYNTQGWARSFVQIINLETGERRNVYFWEKRH